MTQKILKNKILVTEKCLIKDALKRLNETETKVLLVVDSKKRLIGAISDGDIRRYILQNKSLSADIKDVYNKNPLYIKKEKFSIEAAKKILIKNRIELLPIVDDNLKVIDFLRWDQVLSRNIWRNVKPKRINIPVVIMSGGKGLRMSPFTTILPKPLTPLGDKTITELIIDEFKQFGIKSYYFTLNYKGKMIEAYFDSIKKDYKINYIWEKDFLGTAGSLGLLRSKIKSTFIVSNCDVIVRANYREVLSFHKKQKADLTILSSIQNYKIPYGVISFKEGGEITEVIEKPEYIFTVNTGVYILESKCLGYIPKNHYFDMTDLIKKVIQSKGKVLTYPVGEDDYIDIGQLEEYKKVISDLEI